MSRISNGFHPVWEESANLKTVSFFGSFYFGLAHIIIALINFLFMVWGIQFLSMFIF